MALPIFYHETISSGSVSHQLSEESSRHIIQVLRMGKGARLDITNGKGQLYHCEIVNDNKKSSEVKILRKAEIDPHRKKIDIAISLIKNTTRFEWFLEKVVEIGVSTIIPLICNRTEKQHFRLERMKAIMVSAMLQSRQTWLPELKHPVKFDEILNYNNPEKFIAHCNENDTIYELNKLSVTNPIILIGPEGDFTADEISEAKGKNFKTVSLGRTRLRTETAGVVAVTLMNNS